MATRPMSLLVGVLFLIVRGCAILAVARPAQGPDGARMYATLSQRGFLEDYLIDIARSVSTDLVRVSGRWSQAQVNQPYNPSAINIYLVDSRRLPGGNPFTDAGFDLNRDNLEDNAQTFESPRVIFIDTILLKSLVTAAMLMADRSIATLPAVAHVRAYGIESFADRWNPARNAVQRALGPTERWFMLYRGALAFILAHELGHIALGAREFATRGQPVRFEGRDRDVYRACPALVDPAHQERQSFERQVDQIAVELLGNICGQLTPQQPRRFIYELGAQWYFVYSMSQSFVNALFVTNSRILHAYMKIELGAALYNDLLATAKREDTGSVQVHFTPSHPPDYQRASQSLGRLRSLSCSHFYGQGPSTATEQHMLEQVRDQACRDIALRYRQ